MAPPGYGNILAVVPVQWVMRAFLVVLLALSGCGDESRPAGGPDQPVSSTPGAAAPSVPAVLEVQPRDGLVDVRPHVWERAEPVAPGRIRVEFYGGVEECEGLDRVEVRETADSVSITLFTGRLPEAEVCIEIAVLKATTVELDSPLRGREILDGARVAA